MILFISRLLTAYKLNQIIYFSDIRREKPGIDHGKAICHLHQIELM